MQTPFEQQHAVTKDQSPIRPDNAIVPPALAASISGNNSDHPAAPQVQVHHSEDPLGQIEDVNGFVGSGTHSLGTMTGGNTSRSTSTPSSSSSQHAGGPHQAAPGNGFPHVTPPTNASNASLAAPAPLSHGHARPMLGGLGYPPEGRISPRPVSRNHSRNSNHHDMIYNPDGLGRLPGDNRMQLFVGNLPFRVRWQDLKDLFRKCGNVLRSDVALTLDNRSKGFGTVLYANAEDARSAIETFNGYTWQSRVLDVRLDQQDPTGSISLANAAAQQAQHHAYQTHQQAMQNMANMVGVMQGPGAAAAYQQAQGYSMFGQGPAGSPWMAATLANNFRPQASGHGGYPQPFQGTMQSHTGASPHMLPGRTASPYRSVQLGSEFANMNLGRNSASTESSSRPSIPQSGSTSSLGRADGGGLGQALSAGTSSRPGTSPTSPTVHGTSLSKGASPSPNSGFGEPRDSISPTSARRVPPGSLGPMPPSMFAGMPQNAQLPHPPAAAAAAVAAGYSLDNEARAASPAQNSSHYGGASSREGAPGSRRGSTSVQDASRQTALHVRQQQMPAPESDASISPHPAPAGPPLPGGLVNFYQQHRGPPNFAPGHSPYGVPNGGRSSPAPAFTDRQLFVGNIPFNCQWQDLKDLFRAAGSILRADVSLGPDGRSRGFGRVVYATPEDAINAMQMFNGYEFQGRPLKVHFDKFAPGGSPLNYPQPVNMHQPAIHHVHESQFIQPSGLNGHPYFQQGNVNLNSYNQPGQHDWQQALESQSLPLDDNNSVPGTPIHEMSLAQMAAFPSPGFTSAMQHQGNPGQSADQRRKGFNSEGVPVAPIGSGAPQAQHEGRPHLQHGHNVPLSPIMITPMSMAMPSPGPGGLFSPPLPGMGPMMTPSMPGFSFHPFPQTPPLLPHFLSPGLGPFSPPLFGTPGAFVGPNGPSGLRNSAPGDSDKTPLQSPNASYTSQQQGNYFPPLPDQPQSFSRNGSKPSPLEDKGSRSADISVSDREEENAASPSAEVSVTTPTVSNADTAEMVSPKLVTNGSRSDSPLLAAAPSGRRASFKDPTTQSLLDVPAPSTNRAGSLDIPRPDMKIGDIASVSGAGSALDDGDDGTPPTGSTAATTSEETTQAKKSAWNLSWLKKQ